MLRRWSYESDGNVQGGDPENEPGPHPAEWMGSGQHPCCGSSLRGIRGVHLSCIRWMYRQLEYGSEQYPGFFTHHALGFVRQDTADGKQQMRQTWQHILDALTMVLTRDKKIRPDAFTEEFTRQKFAGILFSLMLSAVVQQDFDPTTVLEIIRRTIYEV